jgi:signal peptidase II
VKGLRKRKYAILASLSAAVILADQWTKLAVLARFSLHESVPVIPGFFNLTYVQNTGAAFGFLATADPAFRIPFFLIVPLVAVVAIAAVFRKIPTRDVRLPVALSLVVGGAIGNFIDRARLGFVVDFLDFHWKDKWHFHVFNVADSAICVGVGLMILDSLIKSRQAPIDMEAAK